MILLVVDFFNSYFNKIPIKIQYNFFTFSFLNTILLKVVFFNLVLLKNCNVMG